MGPIAATRTSPHPPHQVFELLSDLRNHWRLEERFVEIDHATDRAGRIRIRGPLGLRQVAQTEVVEAQPPAPVGRLHGRAEIGRSTRGDVYREIRPGGAGGSEVTLTAVPERLGAPDAFLLAAGGRRWLCRLFGGALGRLDAVLAEQGRD
jgi:uncharacterized protein YndB with AHSA1/START domain